MAKSCENCGRDFTNWWNWIRFWNRPVKQFSVGAYCFSCADPNVLLAAYWKSMAEVIGKFTEHFNKGGGA